MSLRYFKKLVLAFSVLSLFTRSIFGSNDSAIEIIENDESKFIFKLKPYTIIFEEKDVAGLRYETPGIEGDGSLIEPGMPVLPVKGILIAIPDQTLPEIKILELRTIPLGSKTILPAPGYVLKQSEHGQFLEEIYAVDRDSYSSGGFYPSEIVTIKDINKARGQTIARLEIHPLQYHLTTGELQQVEQLTVAIHFKRQQPGNADLSDSRSIMKANLYEHFFQKVLSNYQPAKKWRDALKQQSGLIKDVSTWYNSNAPNIKLFVDQPGIYRLDFSYLTNLGIDLSQVDPGTIKIYHKGQEKPLLVKGQDDRRFDADDYLEFYGQKNNSDDTAVDPYTDTNVYWLTWGGVRGLRYLSQGNNSNDRSEFHDYLESVHLEQNKIYYYGFSDYQVHNTELAEGEGWIWRYFYPGESETIKIPINIFWFDMRRII